MACIVREPDISELDGDPTFRRRRTRSLDGSWLSIGVWLGVGYRRLLGRVPACGRTAARPLGRVPASGRVAARQVGGGCVEEAEHPFTRRHRLLKGVELVGQVLEWLEKAADELQERRERAEADRFD